MTDENSHSEDLLVSIPQLPVAMRRVISVALLFYLLILVLGPLSNPNGSEHLSRPLARFVAPIHRVLFMGHGYRFFAPDPGPGHLVEFRITKPDGAEVNGRFPDPNDKDRSFARLQYHRWFMLSETIWSEGAIPVEQEFLASQKQLEQLANEKQLAGHRELASKIRADKARQHDTYKLARKRFDELVRSVAKGLLRQEGGTRIRLYAREREIPYPFQVQEGIELDDPQFLKPVIAPLIGDFTAEELGIGVDQPGKGENVFPRAKEKVAQVGQQSGGHQ